MRYAILSSPIGPLLVGGDGERLVRLDTGARPPSSDWQRDEGAFTSVRTQLEAYFAGELRNFELELAPVGTAFQQRVWAALRAIPFGEIVSYAELARRIDRPGAARAVGHANARNPIAIIVPCHRVCGANGTLTGYAGGLPLKRKLLELEARVRHGTEFALSLVP